MKILCLTALLAAALTSGAPPAAAPDAPAPPRVATYSIVARDPATGELGVAVQSRVLGVGSIVPYAKAGVGAVATQSMANTAWGPEGLALLAKGKSAEEALKELVAADAQSARRQAGIIAPQGAPATFTGDGCMEWAGSRTGEHFTAQGNILAGPAVVDGMAEAFTKTEGPLANRMMAALDAAQAAGGDKRGMQSAALLVVREGWGYGGQNDRYIDLRVEDHAEPLKELRRLLEMHGKIFRRPKTEPSTRAGDFAAEKNDDRLVITNGGKPVAHFVFHDAEILRPYFAHVHSPAGVQLTRSHPPVAGRDAVDHAAMHPGIWLAFGDVCGHDFWRNKAAVRHVRFALEPAVKDGALTFASLSQMVSAEGTALADMESTITFSTAAGGWLLTWDASFTPLVEGFHFGDQEEMGLGVRMATGLTEKQGGVIVSSTGKRGAKDTWGQVADWCDYSGTAAGKPCGVTLMASPGNFRQSWFHNRDYGLMVANPFGQKAFTKGEISRVAVEKGKPLRLRFGVLLHDGPHEPAAAWREFSGG